MFITMIILINLILLAVIGIVGASMLGRMNADISYLKAKANRNREDFI